VTLKHLLYDSCQVLDQMEPVGYLDSIWRSATRPFSVLASAISTDDSFSWMVDKPVCEASYDRKWCTERMKEVAYPAG
jgi:hypothetical protein